MKKLFLCLFAILFVNQLNAQHLRARPAGSRESSREATTRSRSGTRQPANSRQPSHSRQPQTTTTTTTTTTPAPTTQPEDENSPKYYGTYLGSFETKVHGVQGDLFAVDESTVFIKNFKYDGEGPDAYFWAGTSTDLPDENGFIIPDEKGSTKPLAKYTGQNLVLRLPEGKTLRDLTYISVWCRKVAVNFGHLELKHIVKGATIPTAIEIRPLSSLEHGVKSGPINIIDAQTFLITDFHYDGQGPAGYWWASKGGKQTSQGLKIPDENGSLKPLRRYGGETVVITLPDNKTIYDYDILGVWCEEFEVDFGHTLLPHSILVPPSAKMLGVKHEVLYGDLYNEAETTTITTTTSTTTSTTAAPQFTRSLNRTPFRENAIRDNHIRDNAIRSSISRGSPAAGHSNRSNGNNLSINRSIVESSRLGNTATNRGRRPPQRRPGLDAKAEIDRYEHRKPIVPISNGISGGASRGQSIAVNPIINRQPLQPINPRLSITAAPISTPSLVSNSRPLVPVNSNSIVAPNNSPINSLISNPIRSSIPINHLARANSFIPINNNLVNNHNLVPINPINSNSISNLPDSQPLVNSEPITNGQPILNNQLANGESPVVNQPVVNQPIVNQPVVSQPVVSQPVVSTQSISNNKPAVRGRQHAGILEYNTKPERAISRPRPERVHAGQSSGAQGRSSSRANRITTESSVSSNHEPNSINELNAPSGGSGFGQRIRG